jgi:hypothetical protein
VKLIRLLRWHGHALKDSYGGCPRCWCHCQVPVQVLCWRCNVQVHSKLPEKYKRQYKVNSDHAAPAHY